jgi:hypothetical protein
MSTEQPEAAQPLGRDTEETSGDYSYDMAHDGATDTHDRRSPEASRPRPRGAVEPPPPGQEGDYSYDLAHEVPPATR